MSEPSVICGFAFLGENLEERGVCITVDKGKIVSIDEISDPPQLWICPCLFNAHTHLGDTIAMDIPFNGTLGQLVAPPNGLKHRLLAKASRSDLVTGMKKSIETMLRSGSAGFADFREGGKDGVHALLDAAEGTGCHTVIMGRGGGEAFADGLGISSVREGGDIENQVVNARRKGKIVAFHAGEKDPYDVDEALAYEPDLIIHCTHATKKQLRQCADMEIPVAVCPRSNWTLEVSKSRNHPPIRQMLDLGCKVLLGTDNVMFVQPNLLQEMAFTSLVYRISPREILKMAILGSKVFDNSFFIEEGKGAHFFTIDPLRGNFGFSHDRLTTMVNRMNCHAIERTILNLQPE
jgi:cytosine/adenosine deaminase-related metal-dependent hydrolase